MYRILSTFTAILSVVLAQTSSVCNPLLQTCPADPALGTSKNIDFSNGASSDFTSTGAPTYDSNGAAFTVAKSGDSPTIISKWYIMFGHVDFVIKAAPGTGIVSSAVLLSDCLDEIDFEWLGGDNTQVQSNYFGKGQTTTGYNRGAFHPAQGNHDSFNTYSIDWTADQIVFSVNGNTVRVLKASDAQAGQYPQTPMQIKVGSWAGGDSANAPGTIAWAGGPVDYSQGPFTMYLKAIAVTDYSTGSSYSYDGTTGTWESIRSNGGTINSSGSGSKSPTISSSPSYETASGNPSIPFVTDASASSVYATRTGYPWVSGSASAVTTVSPTVTYTSINGLPSGWTVGADGKVRPPDATAAAISASPFSFPGSSRFVWIIANAFNRIRPNLPTPHPQLCQWVPFHQTLKLRQSTVARAPGRQAQQRPWRPSAHKQKWTVRRQCRD